MNKPIASTAAQVYRPLVKYRVRAWAQAVTYIGLGGFLAFADLASSGWLVPLLLVIGGAGLAGFGLLMIATFETTRLEVSAQGVVYRNAFGRLAATPGQVAALDDTAQPVLRLDQNRFQRAAFAIWVSRPPYSNGSSIPVYLFLDAWQERADLESTAVGRSLLRALPRQFETLLPGGSKPPQPVPNQLTSEQPPVPEAPLVAGHYRLRSRSAPLIMVISLLAAAFFMALAGMWNTQMVLLPGLLAGWMLTLMLGGIEVRPTPLTDLLGLAAIGLLGGLAALFLWGGCEFFPAPGCTAEGFRLNLLSFFFYPFIMYLIPWLIFTRLRLLWRTVMRGPDGK